MPLIFKRGSGILIPKSYSNEIFYKNIKSHLTRTSRNYGTSILTTAEFFEEDERGMKIPRFFPIQKFVHCEVKDVLTNGKKIKIKHNIKLKNKTQEEAVKYFKNNNGVLRLDPGMGKTVIGIYLIAIFKVKTFILVHRDALVDQWQSRLLEHSNLTPEDIGVLSTATFDDYLKEKSVILCTDQAFGAIMRSKRSNEFKKALIDAKFGFLIADEVHTSVGAPGFSKCSLNIPAKRVLGLSATPYRYDGNGDIILAHLGEIFSIESREGILNAKVMVFLFNSGLVETRQKYLYWGGQFQRSRYLTILKKSKLFMALLEKIISRLEKDREVIFVAERLKLIDECMKLAKEESKIAFTAGINLNEVLDKKIIFTTPGKMRDGIDISHKDCLVMTSPISNIAQIAGRIIRSHPGKKNPVIFDLVDLNVKDIRSTYKKRMDYYQKNKWNIEYILAENRKFKKITRNKALDLIF